MTDQPTLPEVPGHHWRVRVRDHWKHEYGVINDAIFLELVKGKPRPRWLWWTQDVVDSQHVGGTLTSRTVPTWEIAHAAETIADGHENVTRITNHNLALTGTYPPKKLS